MVSSKEKHEVGEEKPKNQINLNPIRRLFDGDRSIPQRHVKPYDAKGQAVADLGCGPGYYTLALAECIGPEGRVHAVDLNENHIRASEKRAENRFRSSAR